jgi:hypothetical protein
MTETHSRGKADSGPADKDLQLKGKSDFEGSSFGVIRHGGQIFAYSGKYLERVELNTNPEPSSPIIKSSTFDMTTNWSSGKYEILE